MTSDGRRLFASYAREDQLLVRQLVKFLSIAGAFVFFDQDHITPGSDWRVELEHAIALADNVVVFWTANAHASEWVWHEWTLAVRLGIGVIPVLLDGTDLPGELARYQGIDLRIEVPTRGVTHKPVLRSLLDDTWSPAEHAAAIQLCASHLDGALREALEGQDRAHG